MKGRARGALLCKKIFFVSSSNVLEGEKRVKTLLQSELEHIVIRHS
jgi:hypothetical protein